MKHRASMKKKPQSYQERSYRYTAQSGLVSTYVKVMETDLHILAPRPVNDEALILVTEIRRQIEQYIVAHPQFAESLLPLAKDNSAGPLIQSMLTAGQRATVGPMAAVAGAVAEAVGIGLQDIGVTDLIVENGGDIFIAREQDCTVAIFAGESPLSGRVGIRLTADRMPLGVCCSSGTIGHSLSMGVADAAVVMATSTGLADAAATRLGNEVGTSAGGVNRALAVAKKIIGITGALVISGEQLGAWGDIELVDV